MEKSTTIINIAFFSYKFKMIKKYILTGGPGSGKSSIILDLEQRGYATIREAAEDVIKYQQALGNKEPWTNKDFQIWIYKLQLQREKSLQNPEKVFLDRGIVDELAYCEFRKEEPPKGLIEQITNLNYQSPIFLIENLGHCQQTEVRQEKLEQALTIERLLEKTYRGLGYEIIKIPPAPLQERTDLILKHIERRCE